jgi:hypothetical protein
MKKQKAKTVKKKNPQDATMRNIRALKKRIEVLEQLVKEVRIDFAEHLAG